MMLRLGEVQIGSEWVPWAVGPAGSARVSGTLYLTSHRLVFEGVMAEQSVGHAPRTLLDLDLAYVSNVHSFTPARKESALRVEAGPQFACTFATPNAAKIAEAIQTARTRLLSERASKHGPAGPTAAATTSTSGQMTPLVFLHCRYCGALNQPGSRHCGSCGATL